MFAEMNYQNTVREGIDTESMEFVKLAKFIGKEVHVDGFFFTNGKFGKSLVIVGEGYKINAPAHAVGLFETIATDPEKVRGVLNGGLKLVDIAELDTGKGNPTVTFKLADA